MTLALALALAACGDDGGGDGGFQLPPGGKDTGTLEDTALDAGPDAATLPDGVEPGLDAPDVTVTKDSGPLPDTITPDATLPDGEVPDAVTPDDAGGDIVIEPAPKCESNDDCPGLQTCDKLCLEPPICIALQDCYKGKSCSRAQCVVQPFGCASDKDCDGGYCNSSIGKCADLYPCADDSQCADERVCSAGHCVECTSVLDCPAAAVACAFNACQGAKDCGTDNDCLFGLACIGGTCTVPSVVPDAFEPNEAPGQASVLIPGDHQQLTIDALDTDYYRIDVPADRALLVRVDFDDTYGQLDVELLTMGSLALVSKDDRSDAPFAVVGAAMKAQPSSYLLHVIHAGGVVPSYSIRVYLSPKPFCINDNLDSPVGNDNQTLASVLSGDIFESSGLAICDGDEDWFKIKKSTAFDLHVEAAYPGGGGELVLSLIEPGDAGEKSVTGADGAAALDLTDVKAGTWFVRVRGETANVITPYSLKISTVDVGFCEPDAFEPNNSAPKSAPLEEGLADDLTLCPDDVDWYRVELPPGKQARVTISYSLSAGVLSLAALTDGETPEVIDEVDVPQINNGVAAHDVSAYDPDYGPTVLFRVKRVASTVPFPITPYILTMELQDIPCEEEETEENDKPSEATALAAGGEGPLLAGFCNPDPADWYSLPLSPGDPLEVELSWASKKAKLVLNLYDKKGLVLLAKGNAVGKVGSAIRMTVPGYWPAGTYTLLITGTGDVAYTLSTNTSGPLPNCPEDDEHEPNDAPIQATAAELDATYDLELCSGDPDVLGFQLTKGTSYQATIKALSDEPLVQVKVLDPFGTLALKATVDEPFEVLFLPADKITETGTWYLHMDGASAQSYQVTVKKL